MEVSQEQKLGWELLDAITSHRHDDVRRLLESGVDPDYFGTGICLSEAILAGNLTAVQLLLATGANPNIQGCRAPTINDAAKCGNPEIVKALLDAGAHPSGSEKESSLGSLTYARQHVPDEQVAICGELLIAAGADPNAFDRPLITASAYRPELARVLLAHGADPNMLEEGRGWETPLIAASSQGQITAVKYLLAAGANPNLFTASGNGALNISRDLGYDEVVDMLLDSGAVEPAAVHSDVGMAVMWGNDESVLKQIGEPIAQEELDRLLLGAIGLHGRPAIVKALLENSASPNSRSRVNGESALSKAIWRNSPLLVKMLIEHGADASASAGRFLHSAAGYKVDSEILELLMSPRTDVDALDEEGETPLMVSARNGTVEQVAILLDHGAKIDYQCQDQGREWTGGTALMLAVGSNNQDVVRLLIARGANLEIVDCYGETALMLACDDVDDPVTAETIKILLDAGAEVNTGNINGRTAFDIAVRRPDVRELLQQFGAKPGKPLSRS